MAWSIRDGGPLMMPPALLLWMLAWIMCSLGVVLQSTRMLPAMSDPSMVYNILGTYSFQCKQNKSSPGVLYLKQH